MKTERRRTAFYLLLLLLALAPLCAQGFPRSAVLDEAIYESLSRKAALHSRAFDILPRTVSLKQYAPLAGDQEDYGQNRCQLPNSDYKFLLNGKQICA